MSEGDQGDQGEGSGSRSWLGRVADLFSAEPTTRRELMEIIGDAARRNLIDGEAVNIIAGAMQVADMQAREIMIPRAQMIGVRADARPADFLPVVIETQHSRFPVLGEDADDVRGILHAKDLLPLLLRGNHDEFDLKDCIRPAVKIPESKRLNVLLQDFRSNRNHMAVVVDEYGHTAGIVTIEDVLEQIVGEIEDEHDVHDDSFIKPLEDGSFTVKAMTPVDEFNERFAAELPEDDFDTIGGIVMHRFGHLPKRDESIDIDDFRFKVLNSDGRRIRLLQVTTGVGTRLATGE